MAPTQQAPVFQTSIDSSSTFTPQVGATLSTSTVSSSTAPSSPPRRSRTPLSFSTSAAGPSESQSPASSNSSSSPSRVGTRPTFRWTSTDNHIPTSGRLGHSASIRNQRYEPQVTRLSVVAAPSSQATRTSPAPTVPSPPRYELPLAASNASAARRSESLSSISMEKSASLDSTNAPSSRSPPFMSRQSSTPISLPITSSSEWSMDEKIDLFQSSAVLHGSAPAYQFHPNPCPASSSHSSSRSRCNMNTEDLLIAHQRHYARVKSSCVHPDIKPWLPMCAWFATTIGFFLAIAFWRSELFTGLDNLSTYLKEEGYCGQAIIFVLILITTFPPLPLYSTLMMLAGYTYGAKTGFLLSYWSSLLGALLVFLLFRHCIPTTVTASLLPPSLKRVVRAIEQRPSIFLLIRIAPYPYNVLNAVLGSSSTMGLGRYVGTTAVSLLKVWVHTTLGSEIRSFKDIHTAHAAKAADVNGAGKGDAGEWSWGEIWTVGGIVLCVGLFVYLSIVARNAVNEIDNEENGSDAGGCGAVAAGRRDGYSILPTSGGSPPMPAQEMRDASVLPRLASPNPFHPYATAPSSPGASSSTESLALQYTARS